MSRLNEISGEAAEGWLDQALEQAVARVDTIARDVVDFPHITREHAWETTADGVWTGGFWAGLLWLVYERTGRELTRAQAIHFTDRLLPAANSTRNHDLGFMFFPSAVKGWRLTSDVLYWDS